MTRTLFFFALCLLTTAAVSAQTPLPYTTGFESGIPPWQIMRKGAAADPFYNWMVNSTGGYTGGGLFHSYPVGGTAVTDDWFVSPAFSLPTGGKIDSIRYAFSGFGVPATADTVALYVLRGSPDPALATKTLLMDFRGGDYTADGTWRKSTGLIIPPGTGNAYIAFRYRTVSNWLDVRFDNLRVSANPIGIEQVFVAGRDFTAAPNPVRDMLQIETAVPFNTTTIFDATGRAVLSGAFQKQLDLSQLPAGNYFLQLSDAAGRKGFLTITKQ